MSRSISPKLRFEIFKRDGFACTYCGRGAPAVTLVIDHSVPYALGGPTSVDNLVTACDDCNIGKSDVPLYSVLLATTLPVGAVKWRIRTIKVKFPRVPGLASRGGRREGSGRPSAFAGQVMKPATFTIPTRLYEALKAEAAAKETTQAMILAEALYKYLAKHQET